MPPRKSNPSTMDESVAGPSSSSNAAVGTACTTTPSKEKRNDEIVIEDLAMPRTMIQRVAKGVLPPSTQIQKDATTALSKSATVFINHVASAAQSYTSAASRKTIQPADVFAGLRDTEFSSLIPRLEAELARYNEAQTAKRNDYRKKARESTGGGATKPANDAESKDEEGAAKGVSTISDAQALTSPSTTTATVAAIDDQKPAKRAKVSAGKAVAVTSTDNEDTVGEEEEEAEVEDEGEAEQEGEVDEDEDDEDDDVVYNEVEAGRGGTIYDQEDTISTDGEGKASRSSGSDGESE